MPVINRVRDDGFGLQFHTTRIEPDNQAIHQHEAKVMAIIPVFSSGVAETDDEKSIERHSSGTPQSNQNAEDNKDAKDNQRTALNTCIDFTRLYFSGIRR